LPNYAILFFELKRINWQEQEVPIKHVVNLWGISRDPGLSPEEAMMPMPPVIVKLALTIFLRF
jgi:hypothetical protein